MSDYPYTLYFSRRWLTGHLKGLVTHETVSGDSLERLRPFGVGRKGRDPFSKDPYEVVDASFQNYRR